MKKMNILKFAFTLVLAFVITGAFAQISNSADYADASAGTPADESYMTVGTTMPFWAMPDVNYHPTYDPATDDITLDGFTWTWAPATGETWTWLGVDEINYSQAANDNYIEVTANEVGTYIVNVKEQVPAAWGGCADATGTDVTIQVVAAPTINVATADDINACGNQAAASVVLNIVENVPAAIASYAFTIQETIEEIDASDALIATVQAATDYAPATFATGAKLNSGDAGWGGAQPNYTYTFNTSALNLSNGNRTRYTYTLLNDATHGIVSGISHKSDYLAGAITYNTAGDTDGSVVFIVNPTPTTGPIYHIPNSFNY